MSSTRTAKLRGIIAFLISGAVVVVAVLLLLNRQYVLDQITIWSYQPSVEIQAIDKRVQFTDKGRFIFYATQPELEGQDVFNKECVRQEASSPILGCYTTVDRIFIYDVTNDQMDGIEEVTAAHEMLHAAWYRLSASERMKLGRELEAVYETLDIPSLTKRMEYYERTEPGEFANELHSILGTEVVDLTDSLEEYYAQYFDRSIVLTLHQKYSGKYIALHERADEVYQKMQSLSTSITAQSKAYESASAQLSRDINSFNSRANRGSFTSYAQFYAERAALVNRSNALEADRRKINSSIDTYNRYNNEYQQIASQIELLNDSMDSYKQLEQAPSV